MCPREPGVPKGLQAASLGARRGVVGGAVHAGSVADRRSDTLAGPTEGEAGSGCRGRRASSPVETWCLTSASTAWQRLAG